MKDPCLDENTIVGFVAGSLDSGGRSRVEAHLDSCPACNEIVTWAAADLAGGDRPPGREGAAFVGRLAPGARVDRYQILEPIGRGAMGEVYAAYHPDLDRRIALKVVLDPAGLAAAAESTDQVLASRERRARLLREARAIARLSHPNVVAVHDAGTVGEHVYVAMEFVDGETLDVWLRTKPRRWREILGVFLAAGRGLAAAHAAGIVHRDFKPQNVMVGKDGSVRVMDFGLARLVSAEPETSDEPGDSSPGQSPAEAAPPEMPAPGRTTRTGAFLGTPAYMAPEQFRGQRGDARSDQFSFCVALHEALHGKRPSASSLAPSSPESSPDTSARKVASDVIVPGWLRRTVRRGLSVEPEERFHSLDHLLAALERGGRQLRRRVFSLGAAVGLAVLSVFAWRIGHLRRFDCQPPSDRIAAAWPMGAPTHPRRQSIRRLFLSGGGPESETAWTRFAALLDDYLGQWRVMYAEACEATHVRGEQSQEVLDLRMRCLNDDLDEVRALTEVVANRIDNASSMQALAAAGQLTPVRRCADLGVLKSLVPLPHDETTLHAVQALQQEVRKVRVLYDTGRWAEALSKARALLPAAEATGYKPLVADLLVSTGIVEDIMGESKRAESTLHDALVTGQASANDVAVAMAASTLARLTGYSFGRYEEGTHWARLAQATLDRLGPGHGEIQSWVVEALCSIAFRQHRFEVARALAQEEVRVKEQALGRQHPQFAIALINVGAVAIERGDAYEAIPVLDQAIELESRYGKPNSIALSNRGEALQLAGRYQEARRDFEQALTSAPVENVRPSPLTGLGLLELQAGHPATAVQLLEEAVHIRERNEPDPLFLAETRFALARALWEAGGDRRRAVSLARLAETACGQQACPWRLAGVREWLENRSPRPKNEHRIPRQPISIR